MKPVETLQKMLPEGGCMIVLSQRNRQYLTNFRADDGILIVTKQKAVLFADFRYIEAARAQASDCEVVLLESSERQLPELAAKLRLKIAFVETEELTLAMLTNLKRELPGMAFDLSPALNGEIIRMRMVKTPAELDEIRRAQKITDGAFERVLGLIQPGMSERELAAELEYAMKKQGSLNPAFDTIAVSGENTSKPHGVPGSRKFQSGDFITMDFGAVCGGYCADMTRTVALGKVSGEQRKVYDTVLEAQKRALGVISAGKTGIEIDRVARDTIDGAGYRGCFGHGLGHSVGLYIHEEPRFSPRCRTVMRPGMVMSVEPGIYLAGRFGVRIEDLVVITETGCEDLTASRKDLIEL